MAIYGEFLLLLKGSLEHYYFYNRMSRPLEAP